MRCLRALLLRDIKNSLRDGYAIWGAVVFVLITCALFPMALGPDSVLLERVASGLILIAALFSAMLSGNRMLHVDCEIGVFDQLSQFSQTLIMALLAKVICHWLFFAVPLLLVAPILATMLHLSKAAIATLVITILLATPSLSLLTLLGAAVNVAQNQNSYLTALLILPLNTPVLIFACSAVTAASTGVAVGWHLLLLLACLLFILPLALVASYFLLRQSVQV